MSHHKNTPANSTLAAVSTAALNNLQIRFHNIQELSHPSQCEMGKTGKYVLTNWHREIIPIQMC
jgi:hypothetical protein